MAELKLNITFEKDLDYQGFHISTDIPYQEDYQMKMLKNNNISGILKVSGTGIDGGSRYTFRTDGWISLEKKYETKDMEKKEILEVTGAVLSAVENIKNYMLNPDNILISPQLIFEKDGNYRFCYLPVRYRSLAKAFHELTEFFVKRLDYRDTEGIFLAYRLHKETLQEQYELKTILEDYRKEEEGRKEKNKVGEAESDAEEDKTAFSDKIVFTADQEEEDQEKEIYPLMSAGKFAASLREEYARYGPVKKVMNKIKTGIWGEWGDLITETDGQDGASHL